MRRSLSKPRGFSLRIVRSSRTVSKHHGPRAKAPRLERNPNHPVVSTTDPVGKFFNNTLGSNCPLDFAAVTALFKSV
jgi:hypothetical protein